MKAKDKAQWVAALVVTLGGCASGGGGDPRDAPGCALGERRCDGDVLQVCEIDAAERRKTWWDVQNCVEFGHEIGKAMECVVSSDSATAACGDAQLDAAVLPPGLDAFDESCSVDVVRCSGSVMEACAPVNGTSSNGWWLILDCAKERGRDSRCMVTDGGRSAVCVPPAADGGADGGG